MMTDFSYFSDRGVHCNEEYDPLSGHLFALPGQRWKNLRSKMTPAFTSGKLKAMFSTILDCGSTLQSYLENISNRGDLLEAREVSACYTTNVIASIAFGIDVDAITNPNTDFRVCGRKMFESTLENAARQGLMFIALKLMSFLRIRFVHPKVEKFLRSIIKQNLEHREKNNVIRKDFFQLMVHLRNTGTVQLDDQWETVIKADSQKLLTENEMAAQTFVFFAAGFETSSTAQSFCLYHIAKDPEIQQRVHDEIDRVLDKHNGEITYESVAEMKYLEACLDETLRLYPVLPVLNRLCMQDYHIPGTDKVIEKDTQVFIPSLALHMDEQYYEEPNRFDPNRFNEENSVGKNLLNRPYLPFGDGPRNCIGLRLGMLQTKVGLLMMLQKFRFELSDELKNRELKLDPKLFVITPLNGIQVKVFKR